MVVERTCVSARARVGAITHDMVRHITGYARDNGSVHYNFNAGYHEDTSRCRGAANLRKS